MFNQQFLRLFFPKVFIFMVTCVAISTFGFAQKKGDYRSVNNTSSYVLWSVPSNWQYYNGRTWVASTSYPGQTKNTGTVTMRSTHYALIDVSPEYPIKNLILQAGTASDIDNGTLLGFFSGTPRTLKIAGDLILNQHSYMGVNIYDRAPADVKHTLEIGGNITGKASPCAIVFYFYDSDVVEIVFNGKQNSAISGLNPFRQDTYALYNPLGYSYGTLNKITVDKDKASAKLTLKQNIYCNSSVYQPAFTGDLTIINGDVDLGTHTASGTNRLTLASGKTLSLSGNNFPVYNTYALDAASEVRYDSINQNIGAATYGDLSFTNAGTKSLSGNVVVNGDISANGNNTINLNGKSLTMHGTYGTNINFLGSSASDLTFGVNATLPSSLYLMGNDLRNLTFQNSADITLGSALNIHGNLSFPPAGKIFSSDATMLTFESAATYSNNDGDSFVDGPVRKSGSSDFIFPTGNNNSWARIGISGLTADATFTAQYYDSPYGNYQSDGSVETVNQQEHWILNRTTGSSGAKVRLFWEDATRSQIDATNYEDMVVARFNGTSWENKGRSATSGNVAQGSITSDTIPNFSPFTFATKTSTLPIELLFFTASVEEHHVSLNWETASEKNNDYFTVERSEDGLSFYEITKVAGAGNADQILAYEVKDKQPYNGIAYYRLKQTDFDGTISYSPVTVVNYRKSGILLNLFPNPSSNGLINIKTSEQFSAENIKLKVYDITGLEQTGYYVSKQDYHVLDMSKLNKGTYFVQISTPQETKTFRVLLN